MPSTKDQLVMDVPNTGLTIRAESISAAITATPSQKVTRIILPEDGVGGIDLVVIG